MNNGEPVSAGGIDDAAQGGVGNFTDGYTLNTGSDTHKDLIGELKYTAGFPLWGHSLKVHDDCIECEACDMEEEIPRIIRQSVDFRERAYRLYVYGIFKNKDCIPTLDDHVNTDHHQHKTTTVDNPNSIFHTLDGGKFIVNSDGTCTHQTR